MANKPPLMDLSILIEKSGCYSGFSKHVVISSKILVSALIVWALLAQCRASASAITGIGRTQRANAASRSLVSGADRGVTIFQLTSSSTPI
jgi:hypothetical protein